MNSKDHVNFKDHAGLAVRSGRTSRAGVSCFRTSIHIVPCPRTYRYSNRRPDKSPLRLRVSRISHGPGSCLTITDHAPEMLRDCLYLHGTVQLWRPAGPEQAHIGLVGGILVYCRYSSS